MTELLDNMINEGIYRGKNYRAELVGVLGYPVDGNPTSVMEEAGFEAAGLNWRYWTIKYKFRRGRATCTEI